MKILRSGVLPAIVTVSLLLGPAPATASDQEPEAVSQGAVEFTVFPPEFTNKTTANFEFTATGDTTCQFDHGEIWECTGPIAIPDLTNGRHTFTVASSDGASASHEWTVDTVKPNVTFRQHTIKGWTGSNTPVTNEASASFTFSTSDPTAELTCRMDPPVKYLDLKRTDGTSAGRIPVGSGPFVPCTSPQALSNLTEGIHFAAVRATDRAGNNSATEIRWKVDFDYVPPDTTPPTISIAIPERIDPFTYEVPFTVSEEASLVCRLRVGSLIQPVSSQPVESCASPIIWTDIPEGQVSVMVEATDPSGNKTTVGRGWTVDRTPPEVLIASAPDPISGSSAIFRFSSSESSTPQTLECSLNDGPWKSCASPVELKGLTDGPNSFAVRATDGYGNTGAPTVTEWSVDTTAPEVRIISAPDRRTSSTSATFGIDTPSDTESLECNLDDAGWEVCPDPVEFTGLTDGPHTFRARAIDQVGNTGPSASFEWTVDTTGPTITLGQVPADPARVATARFTWSAETGTSFRCRVNSRQWEVCSSPFSAASLSDGNNRFEVIGTDSLGNQGAPAVFTWVIETPPPAPTPAPTVSIVSGPSSLTSARYAEFVIEHTPGTTLSCRSTLLPFPFSVAWRACESPVVIAGFQDGNQNFEVRATGPEGRVSVVKGWSWRVDGIAPRVDLKSSPLATTSTTLADFAFSSNDRTATFLCSLDSAPLVPCSSPVQLDRIGLGIHTFEIVAVDPAGNRSTPLRHTWQVIEPDPDYTVFGEIPFPATDPEPEPDPVGPEEQPEDGPEVTEPPAPTGDPVPLPVQTSPGITPAPRILGAPSKTASRRPLFRLSAPAAGTANVCSVDRGRPVRCGSAFRPAARLSRGAHLLEVRTRASDGTLSEAVVHRFRIIASR